jgi:hypothetical protein
MINCRRAASISPKNRPATVTTAAENLINGRALSSCNYYLKANGVRTIIVDVNELKKSFGGIARCFLDRTIVFDTKKIIRFQRYPGEHHPVPE